MATIKWQSQKVHGRDEVLRAIEKSANEFACKTFQDARGIMHDYEVDIYRLVMGIGKRYGMDTAYEIMSDTVADKRLRWLDQAHAALDLSGSALETGLRVYLCYFHLKNEDYQIVERSENRVVIRRKDYVDAIAYACDALGLDVIEVQNKVYARAMNLMFARVCPGIQHVFLKFQDGWYEEMIEQGLPLEQPGK